MSSECDSEDEVKLISSPKVITVSCCENMVDVSTQMVHTKPVNCKCDQVLQKLDEVLDGLKHLQDELSTQGYDLLGVRDRCLLIEKHGSSGIYAQLQVTCRFMTVQHVHFV